MTIPSEQLHTPLKNIVLSADEKTRMRSVLSAAMRESRALKPRLSWVRLVPAAMLGVIVACSGVAIAARDARPGSIFYPVRLQVTEPLETSFIRDEDARMDRELDVLAQRIEDETLFGTALADDEEENPEVSPLEDDEDRGLEQGNSDEESDDEKDASELESRGNRGNKEGAVLLDAMDSSLDAEARSIGRDIDESERGSDDSLRD